MESQTAESMTARSTNLPQPSKISAMYGKSLSEVSGNDANIRAQNTMMPPPLPAGGIALGGAGSLKHKPSNLPEPATKRKTLAERAGEVHRSAPAAPPSSRPVNGSVRAVAAAGVRNHASYQTINASSRAASSTSNSSAGYGSIGSRNSSASSMFNGSIGPGSRAPSAQNAFRPHSSMSHNRPGYNGSRGSTRPASVIGHFTSAEDSISRKPSGSPTFSYIQNNYSKPTLPKQRRKNNSSEPSPSCQRGRKPSLNVERNPFRTVSISTGMSNLTLTGETAVGSDDTCPGTPSYIPKLVKTPVIPLTPSINPNRSSPSTVARITRSSKTFSKQKYLNRNTNTLAAWDPSSRIEEIEQNMKQLYGMNERMEQSLSDRNILQEQVNLQKTRINELDSIRTDLSATAERLQARVDSLQATNNTLQGSNANLQSRLDDTRRQYHDVQQNLDELRRSMSSESEERSRKHRKVIEDLEDEARRKLQKSINEAEDEAHRLQKAHKVEIAELEKRLLGEIEAEKTRRIKEIDEKSQLLETLRETAEKDGATRDNDIQSLKSDLSRVQAELVLERSVKERLTSQLTEASTVNANLESSLTAMKAKAEFLESDSQAQSQEFAYLKRREQEAIAAADEANAKLRTEETLRRKLHNQVQELKGNIRVFCRVRPTMETEAVEAAKITFPDDGEDAKEIMVLGPEQKSSLGSVTTSKNGFSFDRVFGPAAQNGQIFEEISQLVQSALDGYNVCIFCYGQTGSGKTYTMSSSDGMIPLAVHQIYQTAASLKDKGWEYTMEGSFIEVYNENLNDLLGKSEDLDKKKLEIRHDNANCKTTITDVTSITLDSPDMLQSLLNRASKNRSVAATKANERSSRSHSVFILRLNGHNSITGERSEGTLNLVDLAGSERIAHSGATGERLKETQNINRSLSCLGDVIAALGQQGPGKEDKHIPYRNSKLTYLLQHSLGGNSKTLMFVMVSPMQAHLQETLTSLKFATKVHNTHIGTARKQVKVH